MLRKLFVLALLCVPWMNSTYAVNMLGRVGVGLANQFVADDLEALSFKVQGSRDTAWGALIAVNGDSDATDYGLGFKLYQILFDEPQLNFFGSLMGALLNVNDDGGFQVDGTLGSEFHIPRLESIGFSFEFGVSISKLDSETTIRTVGHHFVTAAVHFYL